MQNDSHRKLLLEKILGVENGFLSAIKELENYNWDFDGVPTILDKPTLKNVLTRYSNGQLAEHAVYEWAAFLELREDVDYPDQDEHVLSEILHVLANPDLEGALTTELSNSFLNKL